MSLTDLDFTPSVPVFDANMALGRRNDRRVSIDTVDGTLAEMRRAGIDLALVYSPTAATATYSGNRLLMETLEDEPSLVPQFVCNPSKDDLAVFADRVSDAGARAVRMLPTKHEYPFRDWVVGPWLDWAASEDVPVWVPTNYGWPTGPPVAPWVQEFDDTAFHDTLAGHPEVTVVLAEAQYAQAAWAMPLLKELPNLYVELSRFVRTDGIQQLIDLIGPERILYGSRFPDSPMAAQLYYLHRSGLSHETLTAICAGNLERLLGMS